MNRLMPHVPPRILDLLADRALEGLSAEEERELELLLAEHPYVDEGVFDRALGEVESVMGAASPMPLDVQQRLRSTGALWCRSQGIAHQNGHIEIRPRAAVFPTEREVHDKPSVTRWRRWTAMAACLVLGLVLWAVLVQSKSTPASQRQALLQEARDVVRVSLFASSDPAAAGATGDVVWSSSWQEGYLRIHGLAVNDPDQMQYQLWIVDGARTDEPPIDGGIFDIPPRGSEVVIPIVPGLRVCDVRAFIVTLERPGGVQISAQERIALRADVAASPCR